MSVKDESELRCLIKGVFFFLRFTHLVKFRTSLKVTIYTSLLQLQYCRVNSKYDIFNLMIRYIETQ